MLEESLDRSGGLNSRIWYPDSSQLHHTFQDLSGIISMLCILRAQLEKTDCKLDVLALQRDLKPGGIPRCNQLFVRPKGH